MQARNSRNAKGIDVSRWQGSINWPKVKADGISFAFIKATQGTAWVDPQFKVNASGAKAAGLLIGAYHFMDAAILESAKQQARHFAKTIQASGIRFDLPPVMDYENNPAGLSKSQINAVADAFLKEVQKLTGIVPIIYTGNAFAQQFQPSLGQYPLWVARYSSNVPYDVPAWNRWDFWQYSDSGKVAGIAGNVDLNEYKGSLDDMKANYLNPANQHEKEEHNMTERDIHQVSEWAAKDWAEAKAGGLFDGTRPGAPLTREEAAIAFNRLQKNILTTLKTS
ncbi:lysozyme [Fontibacillus phaseoli]|uniref:Lysozyme n=1 Tax=Fontibacillus phaseoli TaxID=1416533 RepID=A0A369BPQ5_9BACL|nr:glycoside hydrolase family 25 protein [Fontibacillus phaseoli]RCX22618.1 lysozyme [Fontibacillus phaseoli]